MTPAGAMQGGLSASDFRRRVELQSPDREDHGDFVLNPTFAGELRARELKSAAVLVPVVDRPGGATVLLTQRTQGLRTHAGQVAFPGGRIDPDDASAEAAALREAHEEIGLDAAHVEIAGTLPDYLTGSGYRIVPVLAVVRPGFSLAINPAEVDDAFETPLDFLMDQANHRRESRFWQGQERFFYTMPWGGRYIWGVTAGIIRLMAERLYP